MAHGNGDAVAQAALNAGVDTLEHGNYMEEETLCQLAESETIWVPTFSPIGNLVGCGRFPDEQVRAILKRQQEAVQFAFGARRADGLGSDSGAYLVSHGQGLMDEYAFMKEAVGRENVGDLGSETGGIGEVDSERNESQKSLSSYRKETRSL